jgi:dihydroorotate dehydrogenase
LRIKVAGITFDNPIGLAAGFDKNSIAAASILDTLGLGFVEVGTVTPRSQKGNCRPRMFRLPEDQAVINRFAFPSVGITRFRKNLKAQIEASESGLIGINIGANSASSDRIKDYVLGLRMLAGLGDYFAINISSPNTPGLRDLQGAAFLSRLLERVAEERARCTKDIRIFLKVSPDLDDAQIGQIASKAIEFNLDGLIVSNTSTKRESLKSSNAFQVGGLSGRPLFGPSTRVLSKFYAASQGRLSLIGVGGVFSGRDAYAKIRAGASLVQLYTALAYSGANLIPRILRDLVEHLHRDGFNSVADAVGADHRNLMQQPVRLVASAR